MASQNSDRTSDSAVNHERSSTQGGASAKPTPANNAGGGTGWGDKGFFKGGNSKSGSEGPGHVAAPNPKSSMGEFLGLTSQKGVASENFENRSEGAAQKGTSCDHEDHSFMEHKPGCPETMPGWTKVKDVADSMLHGQGR